MIKKHIPIGWGGSGHAVLAVAWGAALRLPRSRENVKPLVWRITTRENGQ